jgi:sugar lactone lactonase YvrE
MTEIRCAAPMGDICGEGAVWSAAERRVYWTDINRFLIHALDEATGAVRSFHFHEPVTALALTDRPGVLVAALASRLILWTAATDARAPFGEPLESWPEARLNDGRADPQGRFWVGSMGNNVGPDGEGLPVAPGLGALMRCGPDGSRSVLETGIGIANTLCWSPDGGTFYFADTLRDEIRAFDFDEATGAISNPRPHLAGFGRGGPDGSAVDAEGFLWNARYGGGCIVRVAPDGRIDRVVETPAANVTTCAFGGPDLRTLYFTTARAGDPGHRLAGSLFAMPVETPGLPERVVRLG